MNAAKIKIKTDAVAYSNLEAVRAYIKEHIASIESILNNKEINSDGILEAKLSTLKSIYHKLSFVKTMHSIKEIKISIHYVDIINGITSNDFNNLRELLSFLKMKEKKYIADALGYDQDKNRLK